MSSLPARPRPACCRLLRCGPMRFTRTTHTIQLLQLLIWAGVILPVSLFLYAGWVNYRALDVAASERAERNLDVLQEHALKVFQTIDRTIAETNEVLRGLSDDEIRADEARLQARLARTQRALPQVEAIWAFDRNGRPLLASTLLPVPSTLNNADRDYFKAQVAEDGGTYIGSVLAARVGDARFFVVSQRRSLGRGPIRRGDRGHRAARRSSGISTRASPNRPIIRQSLIRADGVFLARFPDPGRRSPAWPGQSVRGGDRAEIRSADPTRTCRRSMGSRGGPSTGRSRDTASTCRPASPRRRSGAIFDRSWSGILSSACRRAPSS